MIWLCSYVKLNSTITSISSSIELATLLKRNEPV